MVPPPETAAAPFSTHAIKGHTMYKQTSTPESVERAVVRAALLGTTTMSILCLLLVPLLVLVLPSVTVD
jgi:hypothetical protein